MFLAENIKYLREWAEMTQRDLAEKVELSPSAIGMWEAGTREPELLKIIKLAELFEVTLDELVLKDMRPPIPIYAINLAYLRKKHGMTQLDIANLLGVSKATACKYENGKVEPTVAQLITLSDFFSVTMDQIIKQDLSKEVSDEKN